MNGYNRDDGSAGKDLFIEIIHRAFFYHENKKITGKLFKLSQLRKTSLETFHFYLVHAAQFHFLMIFKEEPQRSFPLGQTFHAQHCSPAIINNSSKRICYVNTGVVSKRIFETTQDSFSFSEKKSKSPRNDFLQWFPFPSLSFKRTAWFPWNLKALQSREEILA